MVATADIHQSSQGELVTLYQLDATKVGASNYFFTESVYENSVVIFAGNSYIPVGVKGEGFETSIEGVQARPTLSVSNINKIFLSGVITLNGLLGSTLYRRRTFRKYLDGQSSASTTQVISTEIYIINQVKSFNKKEIVWELSSVLDQEGEKLPKRQIIKSSCSNIYRTWNGTAFDYTTATCPYAGTGIYTKIDGISTSNATDECSKSVAGCNLRYPGTSLPFRGFPGVSRLKG